MRHVMVLIPNSVTCVLYDCQFETGGGDTLITGIERRNNMEAEALLLPL